jgi:hypothetical protein
MKKKDIKDRYIISLQASSIMRAIDTNGEVVSKPSMYTGVFPYSLEMIALEKVAPRTFTTIGNKKILTSIINVQFDNSYYEYKDETSYKVKKKKGNITVSKSNTKRGDKILGISQLRKKLYNDGFILDGAEYVEYKRSGSKAKEGNHLFILKDFHSIMQNYSRLGIQFPTDKTEEFDLTSAKAYESLVGSAIEYTLDIKPEEILIVRDIKNTFKATVNMVAMKDGKLISKIVDDYDMTNDCFDGESLMDSSLFKVDEDGKQKGFQLLRSNYFKSASFNTNLQEFFTHTNTTTVYNMFGKSQDASNVKLVITPNSLKIFKFKKYIKVDGKTPEQVTDEDAYNYWLGMIDTTFGVVKSEHISNLGNGLYNVMSYQMLNSIPLTLPDVKKVLETDFNYILDVKNHTSVFRDMIKNNKISDSGDIVTNLLCLNDEFMKVDLAKELRSNTIKNYKETMKGGKISVQGDYGTICSMPWEFLNSILYQETDEIFNEFKRTLEPLQAKGEICCSALEPKQNVTIFRSPHICAGNVIVATNKVHKEFTDWFNFTRGILVVTPWEWDIMERGNGLDFDSDSALIVLDETIYTRALEVQNFATPILMDKKYEDKYKLQAIVPNPKPRYNTPDNLADLDDIISVNKIGEICNLAQVLNSYYWNEYYKDDADQNYLDAVYEQINILAILSNIEIDKSKHTFDLDMEDILNDIKVKKIDGKPIIGSEKIDCEKQFGQKKMKEIYEQQMLCIELSNALENMSVADEDFQYCVDELKEENKKLDILKSETSKKVRTVRPYFLKFRQDGQYVWSKDINCPMNYIVDEIEKNPLRPERNTSKIKFYNYIDTETFDKEKGTPKTKQKMYDIIMEFVKLKNDIDSDYKRNKDNDWKRYNNLDEETLIKLDKLIISPETMVGFIYKIYAEKEDRSKRYMKDGEYKHTYVKVNPELYKNRLAIMGILNKGYWNIIKECLKLQAGTRSELIQDDDGKINLWGIKYSEITKDCREDE